MQLRHRVRVFVPGHRVADAEGAPERAVRDPAGVQPAGHLLADSHRAAAANRTKFVFDHHDLCPELFESRFPEARACRTAGCSRWSGAHRTADHVISTNDSYGDRHQQKRQEAPAEVTVVRTGPDPESSRRPQTQPYAGAATHLAAYIGVMGPQDGVDIVVRAAES